MTDLSSGLDPGRELLLADQPTDPGMRESVNAWLSSDDGLVGMPRVSVEAVGDAWDEPEIQVNLALPGGRVLTAATKGSAHERSGSDGAARHLGSGPLSFELVEPFVHWRLRFDGTLTATTVSQQLDHWLPGRDPGDEVSVSFELELRSAAPAWEVGTLSEEAGRVLATQDEGAMMGGPRFEQLVLASGTVTLDGTWRTFEGRGLRIRRTGVRGMAEFRGHVWQSAVFPSGRAFGLIVYPERDDGRPTLNEAFVWDGGALEPARVVEAPWLAFLAEGPTPCPLVLETADGVVEVGGETALPTFKVLPPGFGPGITIEQSIARYALDGEETFGMIERSRRTAELTRS